jgi:putative ABC transport system permease protein
MWDADAAPRAVRPGGCETPQGVECVATLWYTRCIEAGMTIQTGLARDLRYALRTLRRTPGFTVLAVLILALGIGASTAIFSLVNAVLLRPLPFVEPDRLVTLWEDFRSIGGPEFGEPALPNLLDWHERGRSFEDIAVFETRTYNLTGDGEPERLAGMRTSPSLFSVLGSQPIAGRTFLPEEAAESTPVAVISQNLWSRRFAAEPGVIGREIVLDGTTHTVIGVVTRDFRTLRTLRPDVDVWVPTAFTPAERELRNAHFLYAIARLAPGVSLEAARNEGRVISNALRQEYPTLGGMELTLTALHEQLAGDARPTLRILLGAVAMLLLITCANVANLLLARGAGRAREIAVRKALGAGHGRVLQQLLAESTVLAALGMLLGALLSVASFGYLARLVPPTFPGSAALGFDWRVLAFMAGIALCTVLLFGAGPALAAARTGLSGAMKRGVGHRSTARASRLRNTLAIAEIALTLMLLAAAGLLLRSYAEVLAVDPGFRPQNLLVVETPLSGSRYAERGSRSAFYERALERVRALPGVVDAGYGNQAPLLFKGGRGLIFIEGQASPPPEEILRNLVSSRVGTAGYLETLGVPLVSGRLFDSRDTADSTPVVVVNRALAEKYWPNEQAVGRRVKIGPPEAPWLTVVGVVGDVRQMGLDVAADPEIYQHPDQQAPGTPPFFWPQHLVVRTVGEPLALASAVRSAVWEMDADQPVSRIRSMSEVFDAELANRNTQLTLVGAFAGIALLLAAVGLYGVLSYTVAQRTSEIGLRMALGAQPSAVVRAVVRGALALAALGLVLGVLGALALTRMLQAFLFGVGAADPLTFAAATVLLLIVTGAAAYLPARRAASVDPMTALRDE